MVQAVSALTEAARAALEALESVRPQNMGLLIHPAKEALRAALAASEVQAEPVAWMFRLPTSDRWHYTPLGPSEYTEAELTWIALYAHPAAPEQPAPAIASAPRVPQGWQIEQLPSGEIAMHAQGIGSCVVAPAETQPRIIPTEMLYALAKALLAAAPQPEGDTP